jgi:hypothetical protein
MDSGTNGHGQRVGADIRRGLEKSREILGRIMNCSYGSDHAMSQYFQYFSLIEYCCLALARHFRWQNYPARLHSRSA